MHVHRYEVVVQILSQLLLLTVCVIMNNMRFVAQWHYNAPIELWRKVRCTLLSTSILPIFTYFFLLLYILVRVPFNIVTEFKDNLFPTFNLLQISFISPVCPFFFLYYMFVFLTIIFFYISFKQFT